MTFFSSSCVVTFFPPPMHTSGRRQSVCWGPHSSGLEGPLICVPQLHYFTQLPFLNWLYYFTQFTLLNCLYLHSSGLQGPRSSGCSTKKNTLLNWLYSHSSGLPGPRSSGCSARGSDSTFFSCAPRACTCLIRPGTEQKTKKNILRASGVCLPYPTRY